MRIAELLPAGDICVWLVAAMVSRISAMVHNDPKDKTAAEVPAAQLLDMTPESLKVTLKEWGEPQFRAAQVLKWVYEDGVYDYDGMTNLPKSLRTKLAASLPVLRARIVTQQDASDGVRKLLLAWPDGATTECVLIPDGERRTACISTQVGCPVGCVFCASGLDGLQRQLTVGEIVEQVVHVRDLCQGGPRLSNVVFMGLGEPLANYAATIGALRTINASWGSGIGARKITVSTVGLPAQMKRLADEDLQITLALSLHAPSDELRRQIIPWAERVSIADLVEACRHYFKRTGREITLEYILLGGLNDGEREARQLAYLVRKIRANVNLIAYNPIGGLPYERPSEDMVLGFQEVLRNHGVNAHVRKSRGIDIDAACGQLRRREKTVTQISISE